MRMTLAALAASTLILANATSYAAAPGGHTGGGGSGTGTGTTTTGHAANQGQGFNNAETIDTQCANLLAGGDNSTSAERRYCRQRGY